MLKLVLTFAVAAMALAVLAPELLSRFVRPDKVPAGSAVLQDVGGRVSLPADRRGHFAADVTVNGRPVRGMIDTGASSIALTYEDGRDLGLILPGEVGDVRISTANGETTAKRVTLNSVRIGGISLRNVDAVVAGKGDLTVNLIGMTFLGKLRSFTMQGGRLVLEQ